MTDFDEIDLAKDVSEMSEEEAKATLTDFMETHSKNTEAYDELQTEFGEAEEEYEQTIEERDERIHEFKEELADDAAEHVNIPSDILVDRFEFSELEQIIEEGEEYSEESQEEETGEGDSEDPLTTFSDKPEKGQAEGGSTAKRAESARSSVRNKMGFN